ncbi:hypothetical protein QBC34DRAFT_393528 [Podospora aff. communis PSN243]|uniref:NAD(P)-binding domain-containing protein n=1 Tax=Podospora aff. communis PSN243 TaxID=3040156 RepID=A0AAV9H099_9PEZI|nr:hypothetical protein QBC34DRAFT_393528 [Podospora aff. communis PSN243]
MHITVAAASPRTAQATIRQLLADPSAPTVKGIYRNLSRVPEEFKANPRFEAVQGNIEDAATLDFTGSDAVFAVEPPVVDDRDSVKHTRDISENIKGALKKAGVKRLVLLSSIGAQYGEGTGEILTNHTSEVVLKDAAPEVVFMRPGYFMNTWMESLDIVKNEGFFYSVVTPSDFAWPQIAVEDIAEEAAKELLSTAPLKSNPYIFELHGPRFYSSIDVQKAFSEAAGKEIELRSVPKEGLLEFFGHFLGPVRAQEYVDMTLGFLPGGIMYEDPQPTGEIRKGKTELVDVFKRWLSSA